MRSTSSDTATLTRPILPGAGPIQAKSQSHFNTNTADLLPQSDQDRQNASQRHTSLPARVKQPLEASSGIALDDVRVFRNSPQPSKIGAHAYTQGSDIHLGPGQDHHLGHESWHAVQQKQGRVQPTTSLFGIPVNDQPSLEREADRAAIDPTTIPSTPAMPSVDGSGESVVQGVFMKRNKTRYTKEELEDVVEDSGLTQEQEQELWQKHGFQSWLYLENWLLKNNLDLPEPLIPVKKSSKRKLSRSTKTSPTKTSVKKKKKVLTKKKITRKVKKQIFQNNLGFQKFSKKDLQELNVTKRKYYDTPSLDFSPLFSEKDEENESQMEVPLSPTMMTLKKKSKVSDFRGNRVAIKFLLLYTSGKSKKVATHELKIPDLSATFDSSHFIGSKLQKKNIYDGILGLQDQIGLTTGTSYGKVVHSERNMVYQFDKMKIDDKLFDAIVEFDATKKNINLRSLQLMLFSYPNEVCTACGTALKALTQATNILQLKQDLQLEGLNVDSGFGLKIITGAQEKKSGRGSLDPFVGKPEDLPPVMHTFNNTYKRKSLF